MRDQNLSIGQRCAFLALPLAALLAVTACGSDKHAEPARRASASPPTSTATTSSTSIQAAVVAGYRAAWDAYRAAVASANPELPDLAAHMTAEQLAQVRRYVAGLRALNHVERGDMDLHPTVISITGDEAVVVDCYSDTIHQYDSSGRLYGVGKPETIGSEATLVLDGGTWKVKRRVHKEAACSAR
jgi:hypothetical protein